MAHSDSDIQLQVDGLSWATIKFSLKININKTECLYQPVKHLRSPPEHAEIIIDNESLAQTKNLTYLDGAVSGSSSIDGELRKRTRKATGTTNILD